jgi:hypothetical protein
MQPYGAPETPLGEPFIPCSELPNPLDISGRHCTSAPHLVQLDDSNGSNGRVHYASCSYYRHLWRWCVFLSVMYVMLSPILTPNSSSVGTTMPPTSPTPRGKRFWRCFIEDVRH